MKSKLSPNESLFMHALTNDEPELKLNKVILERLNYHFLLSHPFRKVQMNSFTGIFSWLFSMKNAGLKAGMASVFLAYILLFGNIKNNAEGSRFSDSIQVNSVLVDTNFTFNDTCWQKSTKN